MKQIEPIQIWNNGTLQTANYIYAKSIDDNLLDNASFAYQLCESINDDQQLVNVIASGSLTMSGQDYIDWNNNDPDINTAAYNWIANQLGLTII